MAEILNKFAKSHKIIGFVKTELQSSMNYDSKFLMKYLKCVNETVDNSLSRQEFINLTINRLEKYEIEREVFLAWMHKNTLDKNKFIEKIEKSLEIGKVVNVKVGHIRPKYENLKEWMSDPDNVYIGRAGVVFVPDSKGGKERCPKQSSIWANPFKIEKGQTRQDVIEKYRVYILDKIAKDPTLLTELKKLKGKKLGCWCKPDGCHGDVLMELLATIIF